MHRSMITSVVIGFLSLTQCAFAQSIPSPSPTPDETVVGPIDISVDVQGLPITFQMIAFFSASTDLSGIKVKARTFTDLGDLQAKIGQLIDKQDLPRNNCASYSANNPVVTVHTKRLEIVGDAAVATIAGDVVLWACAQNPVRCSKVEWTNSGAFGTPSPTLRWFDCNPPVKTIVIQQPITMSLPMRLLKVNDSSVSLNLERPNVQLGGHPALSAVRDFLLNLFGVDINNIADNRLRSAIDPAKLIAALPDDFRKLGPKIEVAKFTNVTGHLGVQLELTALVKASELTEFLKIVAQNKKPS